MVYGTWNLLRNNCGCFLLLCFVFTIEKRLEAPIILHQTSDLGEMSNMTWELSLNIFIFI